MLSDRCLGFRCSNTLSERGTKPLKTPENLYKLASGREEQLRRKNKLPYFLATLEQLVGERPTLSDDTDAGSI